MRLSSIVAALAMAAPAAVASADTVAFVGPAGWSHSPPPAVVDPNRTIDQWHISGDIATVTFIKDTSTAYSDALAAVQKNVTTNSIKTSADKDVPCRGTTGHVIEFGFGPDGHRVIINRLMVPDGAGVDSITYSRSDGSPFDSDVKAAETAFCAGS